ncbi:MAG: site-specific integrase [Candidatus Adiutrix sp.]|nr:site-specific integrase [Candidatus Adiutrix sp.]
MASIRKRGPYQWEVRIRKKGMPVTCKTFEIKTDAEKWARELESEMDRGVYVPRGEAEQTTLKEALERYIEEYLPRLSPTHFVINRNKVRALQRRDLAEKFLAAIRGKDIADFVREREAEGVSGNTIRLDLAILSRLFNLAISDWGMESLSNPVSRVSKPKVNKGRERRLEEGEEDRLLATTYPEMRDIIRLALETAMRREELSNLRWRDIDLAKRTATLYETKNGETRTAPLSPKALEMLQALKSGPNGQKERVFTQSPSAITQAMRRACKTAGLINLHFHDLRHEATSRLFENTDLDLMEIRSITGHKSLQMLARYSHLRMDRLAGRLAGAKRGEGGSPDQPRPS